MSLNDLVVDGTLNTTNQPTNYLNYIKVECLLDFNVVFKPLRPYSDSAYL